MAIVYGDKPPEKCCTNKCLPIAPEYEEVCCPDPCNPCETKKCPPMTCASNTIKIGLFEAERCFSFKQMGCDGRPVPAIRTCFRMEIRRKGYCQVLLKITPYLATSDNQVCFKWGDVFKSLPKGYYEGDIYINDSCVTHVLLYLPGCQFVVSDSDAVIVEGCGGSIGSGCCVVPQTDEVFEEPVSDGCDEGCK